MSLESQILDPKDLWRLWIKRYESELLKQEYTSVLSNSDDAKDDANFEKARAYMQEFTALK